MTLRPTRRTFLKLCVAGSAFSSTLSACTPQTQVPPPLIISRAEWGAKPPHLDDSAEGRYDPVTNPGGYYIYDQPLSEILTTIVVHHTALPLTDGPHDIQQKHIQQRGYADIAYHFVISDAGQIYEGRPLTVRGAHTGGHNTGTVGIVLMSNFEQTTPLDGQLATLLALSHWLIQQYGIAYLAGHHDFQPDETVCPGATLAALLPTIASDLGVTFGTQGYRPPAG